MRCAQVILVRSELSAICTAIDISRSTLQRINLNLSLSFVYNILAIPAAAGIFELVPWLHVTLPPWLAGLAMALSSVSVVTSSLTLNWFTPEDLGDSDQPLTVGTENWNEESSLV